MGLQVEWEVTVEGGLAWLQAEGPVLLPTASRHLVPWQEELARAGCPIPHLITQGSLSSSREGTLR